VSWVVSPTKCICFDIYRVHRLDPTTPHEQFTDTSVLMRKPRQSAGGPYLRFECVSDDDAVLGLVIPQHCPLLSLPEFLRSLRYGLLVPTAPGSCIVG
jgi:hypothetical protein